MPINKAASFLILLCSCLLAEPLHKVAKETLRNDYKLQSFLHNIASKKYLKKQAYDNFFPSISANTSYGIDRYHYNYPTQRVNYNSKTYSYNVTLRQPIYQPKIYAMIKDSKLKLQYAKVQKKAYVNELLKDLVSTYIDAMLYKTIKDLYFERYENYRKILRDFAQKRKYHFVSESDYYQAKAKEASAKSDYLQTQIAYDNAIKKLQLIAHKNIDIDYTIKENFNDIQLENIDLRNNPTIRLYALNKNIAKNEIRKRGYEQYPSLSLSTSYSDTDSSDSITRRGNFRAFLELNIPIFNKVLNDAKKEAIELYQSANYDYLDKLNSLKIDYQKAKLDLETYQEMLTKDQEAIKSSQIYLQKALLSYQNRLIGLSDLYNAKNEFYNSKITYEQHKAMLMKSYVNILYLEGRLDLDSIQKFEQQFIK